MKILEIIYSLSSGGAERFVVDLSNELVKRNEVVILTLKDDTLPERNFYKSFINEKVKCKNLGMKDGFSLKSLKKVNDEIRRQESDVVHIHMTQKYCLYSVFFNKTSEYFTTIHNDLRGGGYNTWYWHPIFKILGRLNKLKFITIAKSIDEDFNRVYGPVCKNRLIYNGRLSEPPTDLCEKVREEIGTYKKTRETIVFLHIARCHPQKNQMMLIRSFNELIKDGYDAILLIVGNGYFSSELGKQLRECAAPEIHFLGEKKNGQDYILNSDAFVLSSLYEGMPITVIEALQHNCPIVSTPVCGVKDVVNNRIGYLSPDFTQTSFVNTLKRFIDYKENVSNEEYFKEVREMFSIEKCAEQYEKFFREK